MRHWILPVVACLGLVLVLAYAGFRQAGGVVGYSLDDAYIHMAMAKHLVRDGVFGVTPHEFSSSSSSPLWTLLLSLSFAMAGLRTIIPLLLCATFAMATVALGVSELRSWGANSRVATLTGFALGLIAPLPVLVLMGMEHAMHTFLCVLFVVLAVRFANGRASLLGLLVVAPILMATRYESCFLIFAVAAWATWSGRWRVGLALIGVSLLPVIAYGLVSTHYGWPFVPVSILLKSALPVDQFQTVRSSSPAGSLAYLISQRLLGAPALLVLWPMVLAYGISRWREAKAGQPGPMLALIWVCTALLHLVLMPRSGPMWDCRYQTYLIALAMLALIPCLLDWQPGRGRPRAVPWFAVLVAVSWCAVLLADALLAKRGIYGLAVFVLSFGVVGMMLIPSPRYGGVCAATVLVGAAVAGGALSLAPISLGTSARLVMETAGLAMIWFAVRAGVSLHPRQILHPRVVAPAAIFLLASSAAINSSRVPTAIKNIFEQQRQVAAFLARYYPGESVALNDIGAPNETTDLRCLDIYGLASLDVARARVARKYDSAALEAIAAAHKVRIAVAYAGWLRGIQPRGWIAVGQWTIHQNVVTGSDTVTFYGTTPAEADLLRAHLREFRPLLPRDVASE